MLAIRRCAAWASTLITHKHSRKKKTLEIKETYAQSLAPFWVYVLPAWTLVCSKFICCLSPSFSLGVLIVSSLKNPKPYAIERWFWLLNRATAVVDCRLCMSCVCVILLGVGVGILHWENSHGTPVARIIISCFFVITPRVCTFFFVFLPPRKARGRVSILRWTTSTTCVNAELAYAYHMPEIQTKSNNSYLPWGVWED